MIISAFSALGLQGKKNSLSSPRLVDFASSNHMTENTDNLHDIQKYEGKQHIDIANGSTLPITAIGKLGPSFNNVSVSPDLSASLISLG